MTFQITLPIGNREDGETGMNRMSWIMLAVITAMALTVVWKSQTGAPTPRWHLCKESLVTQVLTGACTLRFKGAETPA